MTFSDAYFFLGALGVNFAYWVILHASLPSADFFSKQLFQKILSGLPSVSNSLDPDMD